MGKMIGIHQQSGRIQAYVSTPEKAVHFEGAIIVVHELWGLTDHIKNVADRFANQGFYVIAPDLYSTDSINRRPSAELQAELFGINERVRYAAMPKLRALIAPTQTPQFTSLAFSRLESCFEYMFHQPLVHQKVMLVGFGLGGGYGFKMAMREPRLRGVVSFYGHAPRIAAELRHIKCPVLGLYGKKESVLYKELLELAPRMKQAGVDFTSVLFEDAGHAFFNDANIASYDQTSADQAWRRTMDFIRQRINVPVV